MRPRRSPRGLAAALAVPLVLAAGCGEEEGTVRLVDTRAELERVLAERAAAPAGELPASALVREPVPPDVAAVFFPALTETERNEYDPQTYFRNRPGFCGRVRFEEHPAVVLKYGYDEHGFRRSAPLSATKPALRVLVAGDSHVEGVVPLEECLTSVLERELGARQDGTVEALNAARGGYSFYNYLGTLEKHLALAPDAFVMVVYGGNDFAGFLPLHEYFLHLPLPDPGADWRGLMARARRISRPGLTQAYHQLAYFDRLPGERDLALEGAVAVTAEVQRLCAAADVRFVCVYLPPAADVQPEGFRAELDELAELLGLEGDGLAVTERLADEYLEVLRELDVSVVDLRPLFRARSEELYWHADQHLNTRGHALVAEALLAHLDGGRP